MCCFPRVKVLLTKKKRVFRDWDREADSYRRKPEEINPEHTSPHPAPSFDMNTAAGMVRSSKQYLSVT